MNDHWLGIVLGAAIVLVGLVSFWILPGRVGHPALARLIGMVAFAIGGYLFVSSRP